MTDDRKAFYNRLPIGEWIKRDDVTNYWGANKALSWCYKQGLIELEFRGDHQFVRRKPTTEIISQPLRKQYGGIH